MEFLVHITIGWPPDGDPDELRAPGRRRTRACPGARRRRRPSPAVADPGRARELGDLGGAGRDGPARGARVVAALSLLSVRVHPLAAHPSDPERPGGR